MNKWRIILALLCSVLISIFGVFIFSKMNFHGVTLDFIYTVQFQEGHVFEGMYSLWSSAFACDWWYHFSIENLKTKGLANILSDEVVLPTLLTWFTTGFVGGVFMRKPKYGFFMAMAYYSLWVIFLVIFMILAGADLTQMITVGFYTTTGKLVSGLIFINIGGVLGGLITNDRFQ